MIEIDDGFFVQAEEVAAVKSAGNGKSILYLKGQSALEGFVIEGEAVDVAERVDEELEDYEEED
jgi:hypothetical protein